MVKTVHSFLRVPSSTPKHWGFFEFIRPRRHKRYKRHASHRSHKSNGDGERFHRYTWHVCCRVPQVRWSHRYTWHASHRVPQVSWRWRWSHRYTWHVSCWVPQVECWRVLQVHVGCRKDRAKTFMTNCKRHRWVTAGLTGTRWMEKSPTGTSHMKIWSSRYFYDELQASQMSNCRSHMYTSDGESTKWRSMTKPFVTDQILFVTDM
jgi:hypothetical protein